MKRGLVVGIIFLSVFSLTLVSAGWFSDFFTGTGRAIDSPMTDVCSSDFNEDGIVDDTDYNLFSANFNVPIPVNQGSSVYDLNKDGKVNFDDYFIFADYYGEICAENVDATLEGGDGCVSFCNDAPEGCYYDYGDSRREGECLIYPCGRLTCPKYFPECDMGRSDEVEVRLGETKLVNGLPIQLASVSSQGGATLDSGNSLYSISRDSVGNLPDSILVQFYNYSSSGVQQINYSVGIISLTNDSITLDVSCGDEKFLEDLPSLTCTDSDIGLNYVLKGTVSTNDNPYGVGRSAYPINKFNDFCGDQVGGISSDLVEYYCNEKNQVESEIYSCPNGCFDGACVSGGGSGNVSIPSTQNFSTNCSLEMLSTKSCIHDGVNYKVSRKTGCDLKIEYTGVQEDLELLHLSKWTLGNGVTVMASRDVSYSCSNADLMLVFEGKGENNVTCENSCVLDGECVPIGYRTDDEFCDLGYVFNPQRLKAEKCLNNFECDSNYCASGECVSAGMMRRIIEWLKRVF